MWKFLQRSVLVLSGLGFFLGALEIDVFEYDHSIFDPCDPYLQSDAESDADYKSDKTKPSKPKHLKLMQLPAIPGMGGVRFKFVALVPVRIGLLAKQAVQKLFLKKHVLQI